MKTAKTVLTLLMALLPCQSGATAAGDQWRSALVSRGYSQLATVLSEEESVQIAGEPIVLAEEGGEYVRGVPLTGKNKSGLLLYSSEQGGVAAAIVMKNMDRALLYVMKDKEIDTLLLPSCSGREASYGARLDATSCDYQCNVICNVSFAGVCAWAGIPPMLCAVLSGLGCTGICDCACHGECGVPGPGYPGECPYGCANAIEVR